MQNETVIREASFDPKVKTYWLVSGAIPFIVSIFGIPLLLLWFPLGYLFTGRYLDRMACTLTNKALKVRKGIFVRVEKTIPLEKITDMGMVEGPIMRRYGVKRLSVETAGQSGAGALVSLTGIVLADEFRETVLAQRDKMAAQGAAEEKPAAASDASPSNTEALEALRDSVLRIEKILEGMARDRT